MLEFGHIFLNLRLEQDDGARREEHLGVTFIETAILGIPPGGLQEDSVDESAVLRFGHNLMSHDLEVELEQIDGYFVFSGDILRNAGGEAVHKEETGDPVALGVTLVNPLLKELDARLQVVDVAGDRLDGLVGLALPELRHLAVQQRVRGDLQLSGHHDEAAERLVHLLETGDDEREEHVEALEFLRKHRVHGILVLHGVLLGGGVDIELLGEAVQNAVHDAAELVDTAAGLATAGAAAFEQRVEKQVALADVLGDVRVAVKAEDLRASSTSSTFIS